MIDDGWTLHHGDCLDVLPTLDPVEAVVTDPPYGLEFMGQDWDKLNVVADPAAVGGFQDGAGGNSYSRSRYGRSDPAQMQAWFVQHFSAIRDALKPAWEPIIVARNPLEGTVAQNVLAHGVGGINIDGCRVGGPIETWPTSRSYAPHQKQPGHAGETQSTGPAPAGRWPANLVHDGSEEVTRLLPARFFYCAKAAQSDRNEGVEGRNTHPTVKPLARMRYLVRLVTPPRGTVLDPFMGSGSTGKAADLEGCHFVGIEADRDSYHIATQRRRKQRSFRYD